MGFDYDIDTAVGVMNDFSTAIAKQQNRLACEYNFPKTFPSSRDLLSARLPS